MFQEWIAIGSGLNAYVDSCYKNELIYPLETDFIKLQESLESVHSHLGKIFGDCSLKVKSREAGRGWKDPIPRGSKQNKKKNQETISNVPLRCIRFRDASEILRPHFSQNRSSSLSETSQKGMLKMKAMEFFMR